MNKTVMIVGAIFLLFLIGLIGYRARNNPPPAPVTVVVNQPSQTSTPTPTETPTISPSITITAAQMEVALTSQGFSPKIITVKKGDTVKFINQTSTAMSVASDPHPDHTDYPEFDQFKSTAKGKSEYSFVFNMIGSWDYHNHLNPAQKGQIIVTD